MLPAPEHSCSPGLRRLGDASGPSDCAKLVCLRCAAQIMALACRHIIPQVGATQKRLVSGLVVLPESCWNWAFDSTGSGVSERSSSRDSDCQQTFS
jgi:hypothetical protein